MRQIPDDIRIETYFCHDQNGNVYRVRSKTPIYRGVPGTVQLIDDNNATVDRLSKGVYSIADFDVGQIEVKCDDPNAP